jgi:hypothetical protein
MFEPRKIGTCQQRGLDARRQDHRGSRKNTQPPDEEAEGPAAVPEGRSTAFDLGTDAAPFRFAQPPPQPDSAKTAARNRTPQQNRFIGLAPMRQMAKLSPRYSVIISPGIIQSGRRGSNPRQVPWEGTTLPLSYSRNVQAGVFKTCCRGGRSPNLPALCSLHKSTTKTGPQLVNIHSAAPRMQGVQNARSPYRSLVTVWFCGRGWKTYRGTWTGPCLVAPIFSVAKVF